MSTEGAPKVSPRETFTLLDLALENIGPFDHAELTFYDREASEPQSPVTIITGENGAGKSIVLDAIRGMFGPTYASLERPLWREPSVPFRVTLRAVEKHRISVGRSESRGTANALGGPEFLHSLTNAPGMVMSGGMSPDWVVDFWRSTLGDDAYSVGVLETPKHRDVLAGALQGRHRNVDVTKALVYFDYLRDSRDPREKRAGEVLYETARKIVALSLLDGELLEVKRSEFTPMVRQGGQTIPLANLSSGNAYMVQRMIGMLGKMHSANTLRGDEPEVTCTMPGLLLLDEAENHLHPRWQKRFLGDILDIFPNLQIIATTHSPFVTGSVPGARVYVCRYEPEKQCSVVEDVTQDYADKPVEDILASAAFDETETFGTEITELLRKRRIAVQNRDAAERAKIEATLYEKNPSYFGYLKLDEHLARHREAGE
jgi:hypothetical protein